MTVKNNSNKIIGFGELPILPDETGVINDSYRKNAVFNAFVADGTIAIVDKSAEVPQQGPLAEELAAAKKKADFTALAEKYGIEYDPAMTIAQLKSLLEGH